MPSPAKLSDDLLLTDLTDPQREAVTHVDGPLLVLAGAGSGKTRVVTRRAAYLVARAGAGRRILAVTFTNKAANELVERLAALGVSDALTACTFHSFCARTLRIHHDRAGLDPNFTIYDQADRTQVVRQAIERCSLSENNFPPASIEERISLCKNALIDAEAFAAEAREWGEKSIARVYTTYEQLMTEKAAVDFDDLLVKTARLLATDEELRSQLEDRYRYVLVDEYQDTNVAQYEIARLLTLVRANLCATGDPDQSIYRWRGADVGNILRFEHHYPQAKVVRLEQNYRSTKRILAAAHSLISRNKGRKPKELWTHNAEGVPVRVVELSDADAEAGWIAEEIQQQERAGRRLGDIAIFYRTNMLSRVLEDAMLSHGIPYQVARGTAFYGRKEIKDLIAYVKVLINPSDDVSLLRIINTPTRGIGQTTVERLISMAADQGLRLWDAVHHPELTSRLGKAAVPRLQRFVELLMELKPLIDEHPGPCLKEIFARSGLQASLTPEGQTEDSALSNVLQLIEAAEEFGHRHEEATVLDWLSHICLLGDADSIEESRGAVTLMTLHAAKGLEFPMVFIIGVEEGLIPFVRYGGDDGVRSSDIEEERRLCFVGMTRARESLTMTMARYRFIRGQTIRTVSSPFLRELPREQLEILSFVEETSPRGARRFDTRLPHDIEEWQVGSIVRHPDHGMGRVTILRRQGATVWANVLFKDGQTRTYNVAHSDLQLMDGHDMDDDTPF